MKKTEPIETAVSTYENRQYCFLRKNDDAPLFNGYTMMKMTADEPLANPVVVDGMTCTHMIVDVICPVEMRGKIELSVRFEQ